MQFVENLLDQNFQMILDLYNRPMSFEHAKLSNFEIVARFQTLKLNPEETKLFQP